MTREEALDSLKRLQYHCEFAIGLLKGQSMRELRPGTEPDTHPDALYCLGPFAVYDRFRTADPKLKDLNPHDLEGKTEQIFSTHRGNGRTVAGKCKRP